MNPEDNAAILKALMGNDGGFGDQDASLGNNSALQQPAMQTTPNMYGQMTGMMGSSQTNPINPALQDALGAYYNNMLNQAPAQPNPMLGTQPPVGP